MYKKEIFVYTVIFYDTIGGKRIKVKEAFIAYDAEDLAEQFFNKYHHVDYDILTKVSGGY